MALGFILRIVGPLLLVAALCAWSWTGGRASERQAWQLKEAAQVKAQLAATEAARATEQALQAKVQEVERARQIDKAKSERVAAALRAESDGLRSDIARFASGSADDPQCAGTRRAIQLGELLDAAVQVAAECAQRGENDAAIARGLYSSWPN